MNDITRNQIIATNIKRYIKENKITQKELAESIGISPSTMSDYMNLRSNPSHGVIQKIADFFGILKSDIDTTYKETNDISRVFNQLHPDRQKAVYEFAEQQLSDQNSIVPFKKSEATDNKDKNLDVLAAHIDENTTEDEMDEITAFIDSLRDED